MARRNDPRSGLRKGEVDPGPASWLTPFLEARYTRLRPKLRRAEPSEKQPDESGEFRSVLQPGRGKEVLAEVAATYWHDLFIQYRRRQAQARKEVRSIGRISFDNLVPPSPGVPGANNWIPIGPSVVRRGQPTGRPAVSGRANGIAITTGETRVYVSTADGGIWRSDDAGASWYSTMDNFDVDPTSFGATSLACGAVAIDMADPNRVYVGTGEGDTNDIFSQRLISYLPSYRGVGPLRSDDGGGSWSVEPTAVGSPTLTGSAFYALAVDPGDRENVVGATSVGLYRREPDGAGGYQWVQKRAGVHSSIVVARTGVVTTFLAAAWGDQVYMSNDGSTWNVAGTGFPAGSTRIGLAVQRDNPNVVYAMVANAANALLGVYRLDNAAGSWQSVAGAPAGVLGSQGDYDLTIAIDPNDTGTIFMAGQAIGTSDGAVYRGKVTPSGAGYSMATTAVGTGVHPDVHAVAYSPGDSNSVWACTDGGVFKTTAASAAASFVSRNVGLDTVMARSLNQHPTQAAVIFCGLQDNGTIRYTGEECWSDVWQGDGGFCVVNWNDPFKVLVYSNGSVQRAIDGGQDFGSFSDVTPAGAVWAIMDEPIVGTPYNPGSPGDAEVVAFGAGNSLFISLNFGSAWTGPMNVTGGGIYTMVFASANRLFVGMTTGEVYRYDKAGAIWNQTRLDNAAGGVLPLTGLVTDLVVDPSDATLQSIFLTFGGNGDYRHVWHFDGAAWQPRSGPAAGALTSLLDVEHNAVVVDPTTSTIYTGADIGVWSSTDGGANWTVMENGLPDAAVLDLQLHQPSRLLRAALHGRGVFEYKLDPPTPPNVELYIRDTTLDVGRVPTVDWLPDPAQWPMAQVHHWESVNIKVDVPTPAGYQTPTTNIDFYQFNDKIVDGSGGVATIDPATGTVTNRVYVEVHNRGITVDPAVQVMLLMTDASVSLTLPAGYTTNVQAGTPVISPPWQTVGIKPVANLKVGFPKVVEFNLPSTMLPPPASLPGDSHFCLVALLHSALDPYTSVETNVDTLTINEPKVGQKNLNIVQFVGTPPSPGVGPGYWTRIALEGDRRLPQEVGQLVFHTERFAGRVGLVVPKGLVSPEELKRHRIGDPKLVPRWAKTQRAHLEEFLEKGRFSRDGCIRMLREIALVAEQPLIEIQPKGQQSLVNLLLARGASYAAFLLIEPSPATKVGTKEDFQVALQQPQAKHVPGGATYRVEIVPAPELKAPQEKLERVAIPR
jgi:hypothetical protein